MIGSGPTAPQISKSIKNMLCEGHRLCQSYWNSDGFAGCTQHHHYLKMDAVRLPNCPSFKVLSMTLNPGKNYTWRLWRTWPGAEEPNVRDEVMQWMSENLMEPYLVKKFNEAIHEKVRLNIWKCMRQAGITSGPDAGKRTKKERK